MRGSTSGVRVVGPFSAAVVAALLLGAGSAAAEDLRGPAFGASKISTSIDDVAGVPDEDVFVAPLIQGEKLTVTVAAAKKSDLRPDLALVRPDGTVVEGATLGVKTDKKGVKAALKSFLVPATGVWGVRVKGKDGTQGAYLLTTKVAGAKPVKLRNQAIDAATRPTLEHVFGGFDGAELTFSITWKKKQGPVRVDALLDPSGNEVQKPGGGGPARDSVVAKGSTKLQLAKMPLSVGAGDYRLRTAIDAGAASYSLTVSVAPKSRLSTGPKPVVLSSAEPRINPRATPLRAIGGSVARIEGANFAAGATVTFGDAPGTDVVVGTGGTYVEAVVPDAPEGSLVAVRVENPDGQLAARPDYVVYPPAPVLANVTDASGVPIRGGSTLGGQTRRLSGANFDAGMTVRFGSATATVTSVTTDRDFATVSTGAAVPGEVAVTVTDEFGRQVAFAFTYTHKVPPSFRTPAFDPAFGAAAGATATTLLASDLSSDDVLAIGGANVATTYVDAATATFASPAKSPGTYPARITDRYGSVSPQANFVVQGPPTITAVAASAGTYAAPNEIPLAGGTTLHVTGTSFRASNTVTLGGTSVTPSNVTAGSFDVTAPASATYGAKALTVTDVVGQSATLTGAVHYVGYADATSSRAPAGDATDDFGAHRGVLGDLDGDGRRDDLVLGSFDDVVSPPGTRSTLTRALFGGGSALQDRTGTQFPAAFGDANGVDPWRADAVAIGDLDGRSGAEIVTAGWVTGPSYYYDDVRVFANDGSGSFSFAASATPTYVGQSVPVYDTYFYGTYTLFQSVVPYAGLGTSNAVAIGDLDGDADADVVVSTSRYRAGNMLVTPTYVTFTPGAYTTYYLAGYNSYYGTSYYYYTSALLVFDNDIANGNALRDVSFPRVPHAGGGGTSTSPCFPGTDVALADVDGDGDLDVVVTWPDPTTTTPTGLYTKWANGTSSDSARIASAVLTNDGSGFFADATSTWFPAGSGNEFWQGDRLAVPDLDGDGDPDLVLLLRTSIDAYTGTTTYSRSALRVLRNDGAGTGFTDVTSTAIPSVPLAGTRDDNLRGEALAVRDLNGDGRLDIVVGTTEALVDSGGNPVRRTRLLLGRSNFVFGVANGFLPAPSAETGEAEDVAIGDIAGDAVPELILISEAAPQRSGSGERLRVLEWKR